MQKPRIQPTRRQLLMRKIFPWAFIAFLLLFGVGVMTIFSFSSIAAVSAICLLFTWVAYGVTKRALRTRSSIFGGGPLFNYTVCAAVIACGGFLIFQGLSAINTGSIYIHIHGRYSSGGPGYTFHRADNPRAFWEAVCACCYFGLVFIWVVITEIIVNLKWGKLSKHNSAN